VAEASCEFRAKSHRVDLQALPSRQARRLAADAVQGKEEKPLERGQAVGRENSGRRIRDKEKCPLPSRALV